MPIPTTHDLSKPQYVINDATGERFYACNCAGSTKPKLRFVAANRHLFSLPPQKPRAPGANTPR